MNAYMWNLEKWYNWTYLQRGKRDRCRDPMYRHQREKEGGMNWEIGIDIYTLCIKQITQENPLYSTGNSPQGSAAAKSLQSCPTLCNPIDGSPPGSPVPGILQARTLEWVAISFSSAWKWKLKVKSLSRVRLLATPWTAAHQAPASTGFSALWWPKWEGNPKERGYMFTYSWLTCCRVETNTTLWTSMLQQTVLNKE